MHVWAFALVYTHDTYRQTGRGHENSPCATPRVAFEGVRVGPELGEGFGVTLLVLRAELFELILRALGVDALGGRRGAGQGGQEQREEDEGRHYAVVDHRWKQPRDGESVGEKSNTRLWRMCRRDTRTWKKGVSKMNLRRDRRKKERINEHALAPKHLPSLWREEGFESQIVSR